MKKITIFIALLCSISLFSVNIVNNGTFEHATANYAWLSAVTAPGVQTVAIESVSPITGSKSAKITVTTSGGSAANLIDYVGIACAKGASYKISFKAKATNAADMTVKVTNSSATGTAVTTQTASLTSTVHSFEFTFTNTNLCSYNFLVFQYGNFIAGTVILLDDVVIEEVTSPLTNGNLCNGDFEANFTLGKSAGSLTGYTSYMDGNIGWTQLKPVGGTMNTYTSATNPLSGLKSLVTNVGTTPGATNASHMIGWGFAAVVGKKYTCTFKAKIASGTLNAGIKLLSFNGGYSNFDNPTGIALTTTPQTFTFTSNAITDYAAYYVMCLQIGTAPANTNITIDDVELYIAELETPAVVAAGSISSGGFTASWNAIPRAVSYDVKVYQGASLISTTNASGQATTSLVISGLSPNTSYTYKVIAKGNTTSTFDSPESIASASFTTLKADPSISVSGTQSFTANGSAQGPATITYNGDGTTSLLYTNVGGTAYSSATAPSTIGDYQVVASATAGTNYNAATSAAYTFSIIAGDVTVTSNSNLSSYSPTSATDVTVNAGYELTVNADANVKTITVAPGAKLTLGSGILTVATTNGIILQNTASGTASFMDSRADVSTAIACTIEQAITETNRNWYVSVPVSGQTNTDITLSGASVVKRNEGAVSWETVTGSLTAGVGYIAIASASSGNSTWSLAGNLNSGTVTVPVTRLGASSAGFNLLGNPYPSYLNWEQVLNLNVTNASLLQPSIWYRTKSGANYAFQTYNSIARIATPSSTSGYIPPMQAFWVRANSGGNVTFTNAMRSHGNGSSNMLKVQAANTAVQPLVRLQIANATSNDEAVLYFNANASNAVDNYDTPKMFESATATKPEIFTQVGNEKLVINGLNTVPYDAQIPVGIVTKQAGDFTISANELSNFEVGTRIFLIDKLNPSFETEMTNVTSYNFSATITAASTDRFSLLFRAPGVTTRVDNATKLNAQVYVNSANHITIIGAEKATYSIYNTVGQLVNNGKTTNDRTIVNTIRQTGVYLVKLTENGTELTTRVIIK